MDTARIQSKPAGVTRSGSFPRVPRTIANPRRWALALLLGPMVFASCDDSPVAPELEACPQTGEFGNYGCARVVAVLTFPPKPWPDRVRMDLRVRPVGSGEDVFFQDPNPGEGVNPITIIRRLPPLKGGGDSLSVWVRAAILEDPRPIVVGVPLPVFAADSVIHLASFSGVGTVPAVDTVYLALKRP